MILMKPNLFIIKKINLSDEYAQDHISQGLIFKNYMYACKSAYEPSGSSSLSLSWFRQHEATRNIS